MQNSTGDGLARWDLVGGSEDQIEVVGEGVSVWMGLEGVEERVVRNRPKGVGNIELENNRGRKGVDEGADRVEMLWLADDSLIPY